MPKIGPKIHKSGPKNDRWNHEINALAAIFGQCLNYKSGLRILIWPTKVQFFGLKDGQKWVFSDQKKWHFDSAQIYAPNPIFQQQKKNLNGHI